MTRMKRITWFRGHLQSSRDKPFRHSEISASTLHYRVTPFSFSSMGATISTFGLNDDYRTHFLPATGSLNFTSLAACDFTSATAVSLRMWFKMNLFCPLVPIFWMKSWSSHFVYNLCLTQWPSTTEFVTKHNLFKQGGGACILGSIYCSEDISSIRQSMNHLLKQSCKLNSKTLSCSCATFSNLDMDTSRSKLPSAVRGSLTAIKIQ